MMFEQYDLRLSIRERALELALTVIHTDDEGRQVRLPPDEIVPMAKEFEAFIVGDTQ